MVESEIHRLIKQKVAEVLKEKGYETKVECWVPEGRLDVLATKEGCEPIKVEIQHTHIPDWILLEVKGDLLSSPKVEKLRPLYWREKSPYQEMKEKRTENILSQLIKDNVEIELHRQEEFCRKNCKGDKNLDSSATYP